MQSKKIKIITCFKKNKNNNLLDNIKNDFFAENILKTNKIKKRYVQLTDNSISIHICFNKKNEIEILHEKLLIFFLKNPNIKPSDVVITSFSIDTYIPYINATFKSLNKKEQIPFFISTQFSKKTEIILSSFNKILNLSNNRFKNEEILALLDVPAIAKNFNISQEEINILYNWIEETNIRWAIHEKHKDDLLFPKHHQNTWLYGIEKLLLSYAMNNTENIWSNVLSCSVINGSRAELIGKLIQFIKKLEKWQKKLSKPQYLIYWRSLSKMLINDFFYRNSETEASIHIIQKNWMEIINDGLSSNYSSKISINILQKQFIYKYNRINNQKFLPGMLNFCHPTSICYIPFKIICIIGADHQSTQNINSMDGINLLNKYSLIGDINIYEQYCYLFLQSISCAKKYFYISYVGYSIKDQSKIYPSVLVDQLLNYIALNYCLMGDENLSLDKNTKNIFKKLCTKYKQNYFYNKKNIDLFIKNNLENASVKIDVKKYNKNILKKNHLNNIHLIDLINFWRNPIRYFVENTLNIKFNVKQQEINTTEPFLINKLESFKIRNILLNKIINNEDITKLFEYYMLSGKLPYDFFGKIFWDKNIKRMKSIAKKVIKYKNKSEEKKICLKVKEYQINGILYEIQSTGLLRWKPNLINHSDRISLWLEHLIYSILKGCGDSKIIGDKNQMWSFSPLKPDIACTYLLEYIEGYIRGMRNPIFLTKSGAHWLDQVYDTKNHYIKDDNNTKTQAHKKLLENWTGNEYIKGEKKDFYIQTIIKQLDNNNIQEMCKIAKKWLTPILNNKKIKKK
jgi:exodeoxyribonuclease V gamma subunit